jgi:hypothetical protein
MGVKLRLVWSLFLILRKLSLRKLPTLVRETKKISADFLG